MDLSSSVVSLSTPLQSDFHLGLTFGTYFMYRARSVARTALSIIFRVVLYSSRERPLRIWFPLGEREMCECRYSSACYFIYVVHTWRFDSDSEIVILWEILCADSVDRSLHCNGPPRSYCDNSRLQEYTHKSLNAGHMSWVFICTSELTHYFMSTSSAF